MSDALTKQQEATKQLGSSVRSSAHSKFKFIKKWLVVVVMAVVPLAVFMNYGWRAIVDFDFAAGQPARQVVQAAPRVVQPAVVTPPDAPTRPETAPAQVAVPHCSEGMSEPVMIPAGWNVRTGWGGNVLKAELLSGDTWVAQTQTTVRGSNAAVRYCVTSRTYKGMPMPLTWSTLQ